MAGAKGCGWRLPALRAGFRVLGAFHHGTHRPKNSLEGLILVVNQENPPVLMIKNCVLSLMNQFKHLEMSAASSEAISLHLNRPGNWCWRLS